MANEPARPSAQQLLDLAIHLYDSARTTPMSDPAPYAVRVQALAAAAQVEQTARVADALERIADWLDSATVHTVDGPAVRTR